MTGEPVIISPGGWGRVIQITMESPLTADRHERTNCGLRPKGGLTDGRTFHRSTTMTTADTSMTSNDASQAIEKHWELDLEKLEAVSAGAFDAFFRIQGSIQGSIHGSTHALNPQPLPPG